MRFGGVILAAGQSSRMSFFKPLLPFGGQPAIKKAVLSLHGAGIGPLKVVTGFRAEELKPILRALPVTVLHNRNPKGDMFSSIVLGVSSFVEGEVQGVFVLPVDTPLVRSETVREIGRVFTPKSLVCIPSYKGKRGHPPLISMSLKKSLVNFCAEGGLRFFFKNLDPGDILSLPVNDPAVLLDMDTDEDYAVLLDYWASCLKAGEPSFDPHTFR